MKKWNYTQRSVTLRPCKEQEIVQNENFIATVHCRNHYKVQLWRTPSITVVPTRLLIHCILPRRAYYRTSAITDNNDYSRGAAATPCASLYSTAHLIGFKSKLAIGCTQSP